MKEGISTWIISWFFLLLPLSTCVLFAFWRLASLDFYDTCSSQRLAIKDFRNYSGWGEIVWGFVFHEFLNTFPLGIFSFAVSGLTMALDSLVKAQTLNKAQCSGAMVCFLLLLLSPGFVAGWTWSKNYRLKIIGNAFLLVVAIVGQKLLH